MFELGDCLVFYSGENGKQHLWVVVSNPILDANMILLLNLTSVRGVRTEDLSCVIKPGEHAWVVKDSYIAYSLAEDCSLEYLNRASKAKSLTLHDACFSPGLVARIHHGAVVTRRLAADYVDLLRKQGFIP